MKVLSLGWGVQSFTLAAMVALGELEPLDYAIHADTTWERSSTYTFAAQWTPWLIEHGVNVVTVKAKNTSPVRNYSKPGIDDYQGVAIPAFTISSSGNGQVRRQCTQDWKIVAIRRFLATVRNNGPVEQWLGISLDEWHRAKDSDVKYIAHRYPLLDLNMTRADCIKWLDDHNLPSPGKSACVFCPYHNRRAWQDMKRNDPEDWQRAVEIDLQIRDVRPPYPLFVHPSRRPLSEAVSIPEDSGMVQPSLLDQECDSGHCFL